jgi:lipopolysaccharide transport system permease protein
MSIKLVVVHESRPALTTPTRYGFVGSGRFSMAGIAYSALFAFNAFLVSTVIFNRVERTFMDTLPLATPISCP